MNFSLSLWNGSTNTLTHIFHFTKFYQRGIKSMETEPKTFFFFFHSKIPFRNKNESKLLIHFQQFRSRSKTLTFFRGPTQVDTFSKTSKKFIFSQPIIRSERKNSTNTMILNTYSISFSLFKQKHEFSLILHLKHVHSMASAWPERMWTPAMAATCWHKCQMSFMSTSGERSRERPLIQRVDMR